VCEHRHQQPEAGNVRVQQFQQILRGRITNATHAPEEVHRLRFYAVAAPNDI
jgi:hypothetical protein